jgi:hypothetical protein
MQPEITTTRCDVCRVILVWTLADLRYHADRRARGEHAASACNDEHADAVEAWSSRRLRDAIRRAERMTVRGAEQIIRRAVRRYARDALNLRARNMIVLRATGEPSCGGIWGCWVPVPTGGIAAETPEIHCTSDGICTTYVPSELAYERRRRQFGLE